MTSTQGPGDGPLVVRGNGLVLREWTERDVPAMVRLFDTAEMDRWTPLASPFGEKVAAEYVGRAHRGRAEGTIQLSITEDGTEPMGEVLLFPTASEAVCELAYAVGAAFRGRNLAARAVSLMLPLARARDCHEARLMIAVDNAASRRVAEVAGFSLSDARLERRERKGYVLDLATWTRALGGG